MQDHPALSAKDLPRAPGAKIIRAGEENAWRDAYKLLAEAKSIYAAERERGYADGMAAARQDASRLVGETAAKVDRYMLSLDKEVAKLAFDIVRRILNEFDNAELVARAARNALADFREAKAVRVKVHPSAEAHVRHTLTAYQSEEGLNGPMVTVETDSEIARESCILSTEFAIIEATIDAQLAAIAEAMGLSKPRGRP